MADIEAELRATSDAAALGLWPDERTWAKLARELSPEGRPPSSPSSRAAVPTAAIQSPLDQPSAHLRLARIDDAFAFHLHTADRWQLIRHFFLGTATVRAGFLAQSPTGQGCTVRFRQVRVESPRLDDVRDGT